VDASGTTTPESGHPAEARSPFQGLGFYTEADAKWFFGRTTERKIILAHLRTARLTLLYAESGVGKSSLLRAGVAARLRELAARGLHTSRSPRFVPVVFSAWKDDPVEDLIAEIERQAHRLQPETDGATPPHFPTGAGLAAAITTAAAAVDATLVIILDQFEEHFRYRLGGSRPEGFADELAGCVNSPDVPANFLIAVREDAYGGLGDLFSGRISNVYSNYLHLEYLTRDAAREAIEKPLEIYNGDHDASEAITVEDGLTDAVLDEVRRGNLGLGAPRRDGDRGNGWAGPNPDEIETPFLQLVMTRLWECESAHGSRVLRRATLDGELGGAESIVRNHLGRALAGLGGQELETATDIFHDLVTPSGVKVAHTADDLGQMTGQPQDAVASVLGRLYEERIVRAVDPAPGTTEPRYEIFHDRLAGPILDWRDQQENARLERAKQRAELEAQSQRAQARRFKRRARIMLGLAVSLLILLIAVVVLLRYARDESASASRAQHAALQDARQATYLGLATQAESQLAIRPDVSLLLYLAAYSQSPRPGAERSLVATLQAVKSSGAVGILHGHSDPVESIAFSPDGTTLASASGDKTIRLWTVTTRGHYPLGRPLRAKGPLFSAAFDPSGQILASGSYNEIILWSIPRHAEQEVIRYRSGAVTSIAFSRRGNVLAAAGSDGTVLLWNAVTHKETLLRVAHGPVKSVALSPDGALLAASKAKKVTLWNVASVRESGPPLVGNTGTVSSVAFSPDGRTIAAGGGSGYIVLWDLASRSQRPPALSGLTTVSSIAFSPDGQSLVAGGSQTTALWDLASHSASGELLGGHQGDVTTVAFSPNGSMFASAGADRTIGLWSHPVGPRFGEALATYPYGAARVAVSSDGRTIASGGLDGDISITDRRGMLRRVLRGSGAAVNDLVFDPVGGALAAAYSDGSIWLWDVASGRRLGAPFLGHVGPVFSIAFDRTGTRLVSGGLDSKVHIWDVHTRSELGRALTGNFGAVYAVAFSPDGSRIAAGGDDRAILLWDAHTEMPLEPALIAQDAAVFTLAFSPNGRLLASGGGDDTIDLWRVQARYALARTLTGHKGFVRSVAFSPSGDTLVSGSTDGTVRLWDVVTGMQLGSPLAGLAKSVESVAFTVDGRFIAAGSQDGSIRFWQAVNQPSSFADLRAEVCSFVGAGLSAAEWSEYAPDIPYNRTCPLTTPN
jgi:WD40 repeat protein